MTAVTPAVTPAAPLAVTYGRQSQENDRSIEEQLKLGDARRDLTLDDVDLPNRRITIAGHRQRLGELTYRALRAWLGHRSATWPRTPSRHILISERTALGSGPVSRSYLTWNLHRHGVGIERIRRDRVLHEALTARADPLHLALASGLSHTAASKYTLIACDLLADQPAEAAGEQHYVPSGIPELCGVEGQRPGSCWVLPGGH